jgi:hypothetical protein
MKSRGTPGGAAQPTTTPADERMALLVRTLWGYRELGCDLARSAAALGVHRSTMRYRLYRIRELTGHHPEDLGSEETLHAIAGLHPQSCSRPPAHRAERAFGAAVDLEQPVHAAGSEGPGHRPVDGDQVQADVGLAGLVGQLDQRRHGAGGQAGQRPQIQHDRPRGRVQQSADEVLEPGHRGVVEAALDVHARHPGP